MRFKELAVGDTFDFVDDTRGAFNSFFERCRKTGTRRYETVRAMPHLRADGTTEARPMRCYVGTVNVTVYHVGE